MGLSRRDFLLQSGVTLGATAFVSRFGIMSAMAQTTDDYKALVCIYLGGGNDGYNTIIPWDRNPSNTLDTAYEYGYYRSKRPTVLNSGGADVGVGVAHDRLLQVSPGNTGSRQFGFHPNLGASTYTITTGNPPVTTTYNTDGIHSLFGAGKLAVVCNVGTLRYPIPDRTYYNANPTQRPSSLFDHKIQEDTWQDLSRDSGWGNSIGGMVTALHTNPRMPMLVNVTGGSSVYLAGTQPYVTINNNGSNLLVQVGQAGGTVPTGTRYATLRQLQVVPASTAFPSHVADGHTLVKTVSEKTEKSITDGEVAFQALSGTTTTKVFPNTSLGTQLAQVARIIQKRAELGTNRRQVFFCSMGGFDNHNGHSTAHPNLMRTLGQAMRVFQDEMEAQGMGDKVTTFTLSDFGRTFVQNQGDPQNAASTPGTDHAWGSHTFVMGGAVNGGLFYGQYPPVVNLLSNATYNVDNNTTGRIIPKTSVDEYAATLARWFGLSDSQIQEIIPNLGRFPASSGSYLGFMNLA